MDGGIYQGVVHTLLDTVGQLRIDKRVIAVEKDKDRDGGLIVIFVPIIVIFHHLTIYFITIH